MSGDSFDSYFEWLKVISSLIKLMQNQVQYCASDHKRTYILNMINLIEKTESIQVLDLVIDSIRIWIIGNLNLNNKERWNLMLKLYSALKVRLPDSDELIATQIKYLDIARVPNILTFIILYGPYDMAHMI